MAQRQSKKNEGETTQPTTNAGWGGYRAGSGRPRGAINVRKEILHFRRKYEIMPVEFMLMVLNDKVVELDDKTRKPKTDDDGNPLYILHTHAQKMEAAHGAAPFMHSRLATMELTGKDGGPVQHAFDLTKLSDEELDAFERIASKAQIVSLAKDEYTEKLDYSDPTMFDPE